MIAIHPRSGCLHVNTSELYIGGGLILINIRSYKSLYSYPNYKNSQNARVLLYKILYITYYIHPMNPLTKEQFQLALPEKMRKCVNQELLDQINNTLSDPELYETYRENLLSYSTVMADGKFQLPKYLDAVKYVSFKLMGMTNMDAYSRTFPSKLLDFTNRGVAPKDIASYVTAYNKSKLVNLIYEQTLIPTHVLNQDLYQKALNVQHELMLTAKSEKVRCDAANSLLSQLKPPEVKKVELDIAVKEDGSIAKLRAATLALAESQEQSIRVKQVTAQEVAHINFVDVEAKEVSK